MRAKRSTAVVVAGMAAAAFFGAGVSFDKDAGIARAQPTAVLSQPVELDAPQPEPMNEKRLFTVRLKGADAAFLDDHGLPVLELPAVLSAKYQGKAERVSADWERLPDGRVVAKARSKNVAVDFELVFSGLSPLVTLTTRLKYQKPTWVDAESVTLLADGHEAEILGRDYKPKNVIKAKSKHGLFIDPWTPRVGQWKKDGAPSFALLGDDSFQSAWVSHSRIKFELDNKRNHPHSVHSQCHSDYERLREQEDASKTFRDAGEIVEHHLTFALGEGNAPVVGRWPDGRRAAFAIVDHADGGTSKTMRALMFGSSKRKAVTDSQSSRAIRGLVGHGVPITKTAFATKSQLKSKPFRKLAEQLSAAGSEIAPHSITPHRDSVKTIKRSLRKNFSDFGSQTWVDHQPDTNCEAINNRGGQVRKKNPVFNALTDAGYRYFWEAPDYKGWRGLNFLRPRAASTRVSFFYPATSMQKIDRSGAWLFRSAWLFMPKEKVLPRLRPKKLDRLESEQGLFIAHTYLGAPVHGAHSEGRSAFIRKSSGEIVLDRGYDRVFADLGQRHRSGSLFVATMSELGSWFERRAAATLKTVSPYEVILEEGTLEESTQNGTADDGDDRSFTVHVSGETHRSRLIHGGETIRTVNPIYNENIGVVLLGNDGRLASK